MEHSHHKTISAEVRDRLYQEATQALLDYRIADGISLAQALQYHCGNRGLGMQLEAAGTDYASMLNFIRQGGTDPKRRDMQKRIANQVLETLDAIHRQIRLDTATDDYAKAYHQTVLQIDFANVQIEDHTQESLVFDRLRTMGHLSQKDFALVYIFIVQQQPKMRRTLMPGLILSLWEYFDVAKMQILLSLMEDKEMEVRTLATLGYVLMHMRYKERISLCAEEDGLVAPKSELLDEEIYIVQHFLFMQKNCLDIYEQLANRIKKAEPTGEKQKPEDEEEENRSEFLNHVMKYRADLNPTTFSMAYHRPFFQHMSIWWMPYDKTHPEVKKILENSKDKNILRMHDFLSSHCCDVDMYAIIQVLGMKGLGLRTAMVAGHNEEINQEDAVPEELSPQLMYSRLVQNMYRFFYYSKWNKTYPNPFEMNVYLPAIAPLAQHFSPKRMQHLHTMLMHIGAYPTALLCAQDIISTSGSNTELLKDCGFCHQKQGNYTQALQYYHQADLLTENDRWLMEQTAYCYEKLSYHQEAIQCLKQLSETEGIRQEDYLPRIAALHTKQGNYTDALQCFFEMKYHNPEAATATRGIIHCTLQLREYAKAQKHSRNFIATGNGLQPDDYIMAGHIEWITGDWQKALSLYQAAITHPDIHDTESQDFIRRDKELLQQHGINKEDMMLMNDMLFRQTE